MRKELKEASRGLTGTEITVVAVNWVTCVYVVSLFVYCTTPIVSRDDKQTVQLQ